MPQLLILKGQPFGIIRIACHRFIKGPLISLMAADEARPVARATMLIAADPAMNGSTSVSVPVGSRGRIACANFRFDP